MLHAWVWEAFLADATTYMQHLQLSKSRHAWLCYSPAVLTIIDYLGAPKSG